MSKRSIAPVEYDAAGDPASVYNEDGVLLNEVAAMTENPFVFPAKISEQFFRALPSFVISSCLREHQKCFPLAVGGKADNLTLDCPEFLFVADNRPQNSAAMIRGFESVARARLRDAQFYVETDTKNIAARRRGKIPRQTFRHRVSPQVGQPKRARGTARFYRLARRRRRGIVRRRDNRESRPLLSGEFAHIDGRGNTPNCKARWRAFIFPKSFPPILIGAPPIWRHRLSTLDRRKNWKQDCPPFAASAAIWKI